MFTLLPGVGTCCGNLGCPRQVMLHYYRTAMNCKELQLIPLRPDLFPLEADPFFIFKLFFFFAIKKKNMMKRIEEILQVMRFFIKNR